MSADLEHPRGEHIVALRTDVLNDAEHALGNLFQRMYHVTRLARSGLGPYADRMTDSLQHLERLLQLVFDYVSPVEFELGSVDCARVVESLVAHVRAQAVKDIETSECPRITVVADARMLARSFHLLSLALERELSSATNIGIEVAPLGAVDHVELVIRMLGIPAPAREAEATMAWEVAARLVELQGGGLVRTNGSDDCTCTLALPRAD